MALPRGTTGSLSPTFVSARLVCLAVKLPSAFTLLRAISIRAEGTFGRLRYSLGGDRPSQTAHLTLSPDRFHGPRLEFQYFKGGIPRVAPMLLAQHLLCLPPILYMQYQNPMSGYSKAPRGLSVLPQVAGIFTGITISPSPSLRQRPNRYAFRAGRNLPDKEFRYLRTVIVTAAVYRGLGSDLRRCKHRLSLPLNLPALGRRQPLYVAFRLSRDLCFC